MRLRDSLPALMLLLWCAAGCGDDSGGESGDGSDGGSAGSGAAAARAGGLDEDSLGSELSASEVQTLCTALDTAAGLTGDVQAACMAEAWLWTFDPQECEEIVGLCNDAGATMLELELPSWCAEEGVELPDCDASVREVIACAEQYGAFWAARTCGEDNLRDLGPQCDRELASRCPSLYGPTASADASAGAAAGTGGSCSGVPSSCFTQFSSFSCNGLDGCFWSSSSESCSGVARSCGSFFDPVGCGGQSGCFWMP